MGCATALCETPEWSGLEVRQSDRCRSYTHCGQEKMGLRRGLSYKVPVTGVMPLCAAVRQELWMGMGDPGYGREWRFTAHV